ncbi:GNAT family N-acetyltransferase [Longispora albida]|uniref:GNAT family N-acetyltransferase n=1 Tax=Longispora albida TaxID=203523 RepID=UPI00037C74BE|nr:GNAT family N-acetyltransferase [Longispora albida]
MEIIAVRGPDRLIDQFFHEVLAPSFPPDELGTVEGLNDPGRLVRLAVDAGGQVLGGAVGDWDPDTRVLLLSFLAIRPGVRGGGLGGRILDDALEAWRSGYEPCVILAEVEDPAVHSGNESHGNPEARLRFYRRRGARALDLPYFQPALGPGHSRVPGLLLMVLHSAPEFHTSPDAIAAGPLRSFLESYQLEEEGQIGTDPDSLALWAALERPGGVPLR